MRRLLVVLLGLIVLGADGYAAWKHFQAKSQPALRDAALAALDQAGVRGVNVTFDGRDARLVGRTPTSVVKTRALQLVGAVDGVRAVSGDDLEVGGAEPDSVGPIVVAAAEALEVTFTWDGERLELRGQVTDAALGREIEEVARQVFGPSLVDVRSLTLVEGPIPDEVPTTARALLVGLQRLARGTATMAADRVTFNAVAADEVRQASITEALSAQIPEALDADITVTLAAASAQRADATAAASGDARLGAVDGGTASQADAEARGDGAGAGAPDDAELPGDGPAIEGERDAATEGADDAAAAGEDDGAPSNAAAAAPSEAAPIDMDGDTPLTPAQCQEALDALVEGDKRIEFRGWYAFQPGDEAKIAQAAALMKRCPGAEITVEAYYDEYIEPDKGARVTGKRASLVVDALIAQGVDDERLTHRGMGYQNRKYPNAPVGVRVLNRRVEFRVDGVR